MIGLISAILLIVVGSYYGLRQSRSQSELSVDWRTNDLPKHEQEQAKRS